MSEEILKALTQLFAIISKQDEGVTVTERDFVIQFFNQELDKDSVEEYIKLYDEYIGDNKNDGAEKKKKLTSVKDSVRILGICKKINKTLTQKQKVVVLIKILELVASDSNLSDRRMEIINTVSEVFKFEKEEYELILKFVLEDKSSKIHHQNILTVGPKPGSASENGQQQDKYVEADIDGEIIFLRVKSVDMYFAKYVGSDELILNGFIIKENGVYLFSQGSTIKTPKGAALYYSDLIRYFISDHKISEISFNAKNIEFKFKNGEIGLRDINVSEGPGKLIGIMGASGAGKTTLLNVLAGIEQPSSGEILINGININTEKENINGVIGYIAQDDLLIEELTVYENLYYNAKLCFADLKHDELHEKVMSVLENLGLDQRKDLKVGSVLDKTISGGQRKRLNIALELIREPAVMFVDEPTSGLSSRDSENVIDLLKELTLKGKLIFVVIHQPSSDIYKMFDKMFLMDTGGYPIFYGNPIQAVTYFKKATNQVDSDRGQCPECGNVNPEQIFNIIEANVVDEYGEYTNKRKVNPQQWNDLYYEKFKLNWVEDVNETPPKSLKIPSKIVQIFIFTKRDVLSKISNSQYLLINFLEAPLLALILAFLIKYNNIENGTGYSFRFNDNIPAFIMMSIIVALFMGLSVSAEEIIKDRKILKRESFLNLSWNSYLLSKLIILFFLSAIQTLSFVLIGNIILEIKSMTFSFWLVLFSVSCFANVLGLNASSALKSAINVYILIPILLIPQMILSGLLFSFDKLNNSISTKGKVPVVADLMASRWAFEAMAVDQFKSNPYQAPFYKYEKDIRQSDFKVSYLIKKLDEKLQFINDNLDSNDELVRAQVEQELKLIKAEIEKEKFREGIETIDLDQTLTASAFNADTFKMLSGYFKALKQHYLDEFTLAEQKKIKAIEIYENAESFDYNLDEFKDKYHNESLSELVRNINTSDRILEYRGEFIQQIDPIFNEPKAASNSLDYRTHFFAPVKYLFGLSVDTYVFNILAIWFMVILLYITLFFEVFRKLLKMLGNIKFMKSIKK
ncbi:ATP-binding cassette domain-containing protein [Fulvivirgaceae bacterium BMA10]|uniref:ATP-binding cassette domain-containing protein n=1 Tax=Splendidivirga corallicola TaxID=3051826 RepID=A0ABT8KT14_9BACT|nr:ATP-binding cassette domain-containing protein [Fulvivirgaceae bacterium BMA10]